ncbi:MAG TPA: M14 family metallopeptidase [Acidobacteriota bacterium]
MITREFDRAAPLGFLLALGAAAIAAAGQDDPASVAVLPPEPPWSGRSRSLAVAADDPWATPCERSGFRATPSYDETFVWLRRLVDAAPELRLLSLGRSAEGRDLWMVVASKEMAFTPRALRESGKALLFAHAGIHAGEIDGKDAGLMLLRDLTVRGTKRDLLERANLLFIPILNVDGHERVSAFSRMNQRGPERAGWRTNARNLNLNRDFAKLDTAEVRAVVGVLDRWAPDLYVDLHVTDGTDHQYDVTFGDNGGSGWSPAIHRWIADRLTPALAADLEAMGHTPGPLEVANPIDPLDLSRGIRAWVAGPRYSTSYGDSRHVPSLLLEMHSLKSYDRRVLGTYVFLESLLRRLGEGVETLRAAVAADRGRRPEVVALDFGTSPGEAADRDSVGAATDTMEFKAVESRIEDSEISGSKRIVFTGQQRILTVPVFRFAATVTARRPRAYWIPAAWSDVIERLAVHGIAMERLTQSRELEVSMFRTTDATLAAQPFEGHVPVSAGFEVETRRERFASGSVRISTDQPLGELAMLLLEPASPDSFFRWGFFLEILQRTEYAEAYVMEPTAERMLDADPKLAEAFARRLREDPEFAGSPEQRLQWFYRQTPFFDPRWRLYPIAREE